MDAEEVGSARWRAHLAVLGLFLGGALLYANSLPNAFVWDDFILVVGNPLVKSWSHLPQLLTQEMFPDGPWPGYWRPVNAVTFLADHTWFGLDPRGWHAMNALWHGAVTAALYLFVVAALRNPRAALASACLFAAHPLHAEAVNYVVHRQYLLSAFLVLVALTFFLRRRDGHTIVRTVAAPAAAFLAVLSLEQAILLPGFALLADLAADRSGAPSAANGWRARLSRAAPIAAAVLAASIVRISVTGGFTHLTGMAGEALSPAMRLATAPKLVVRYLAWLVVPIRQPYEGPAESLAESDALGALLLVLLLAWTAIRTWRTRAWPLAFGAAWFGLGLSPFLNLVPLYDLMGERWTYLPAMGPAIALGALVASVRHEALKPAVAAAFWVAVALLSVATIRRTAEWRDNLTIFLAVRPHVPPTPTFLGNLAGAFARAGRLDDAVRTYREALALDPGPMPLVRERPGRDAYRRALARHADFSDLHGNLGNVLRLAGRNDEALIELRTGIERNGQNANVWNNLGVALDEAHRAAEARAAFETAVRLRPADPTAQSNLGNHHFRAGDWAAAEAAYRVAIGIDPSFADAWFNLGSALTKLGRGGEANACVRKALSLDPRLAARAAPGGPLGLPTRPSSRL